MTKKSGYVAIVGRPNVGKSTLMNHLIGQKIAITANKPQTTRNRIQTVYTDERGQIIYLDTPGIHKAETKLGEFMVDAALRTIPDADVVLYLVEPCEKIGKGDEVILEKLRNCGKPVILILNKVDRADSEAVEKTEELFRASAEFRKIVRVSALRGTKVSKVTDAIFSLLPEGPLYYDEDTLTNVPMRDLAAEIVREKALRLLQDEIPHGIACVTEQMKQRKNGLYDVDVTIYTEKESHKGIIIGKGGSMLKKIGTAARADIETMTENKVNLKLFVKVRENWKDNEAILKSFGYREEP